MLKMTLPSVSLPGLRRRRSVAERANDALRSGIEGGLRTAQAGFRDVRGSLADVRFGDLTLPEVHAPAIKLSDVRTPEVRLPSIGVADLRNVAAAARPARRKSNAAAIGPILGAVFVGLLAGLWLATWPLTAGPIRSFFDGLRQRLGLSDAWRRAPSMRHIGPMDAEPASVNEPPLAARRRKAFGEMHDEAGVAVGPGHSESQAAGREEAEVATGLGAGSEWSEESSFAGE